MNVHASNATIIGGPGKTLCGRLYARQSKAERLAMAALKGTPVECADGLTYSGHEPIMYHFDVRVTCPLCRDAIRRKVAFLQQGLGTVDRTGVEGCGDSGCICRPTSGMATNGGCRCDDRTVRRALVMWRRYAGELEARVK